MPYPNTYYYFLKENHPKVIADESGVSLARLPLVAPVQESITIASVEYQILEHQVVIYEDLVADLPRQNNYSYVAILSMRDGPFLQMGVGLDTRNFQYSSVTFREFANNQEKALEISDSERKIIQRMAAFFSMPGMREIHAKKNAALQTVSGTYFTQLKQLWSAKPSARLSLVDELIPLAQNMLLLGGQNFLPLLERIKKNLKKKQTADELRGFHLVDASDLVVDDEEIDEETIWVDEATTNGGSYALRELKTVEFQQKCEMLDFPDGEIRERVSSLDLSQLHEIYARVQDLALLVEDESIAVSFAKIKQIHKVMNVSLRTIVERLREVFLKATADSELTTLEGSPGLSYLDDGILAELIINRNYASLAFLLRTGNFAIDLISVTHEGKELSLLELATKHNEQDIFGILLSNGANPIFVTRLNRCFAHDILQANLPFAQILCAINSVNIVPRDFFQELACIVKVWKKYVALDVDVEQPELEEICQRYLGYSSDVDVVELSFPGDLLAPKFIDAGERTGIKEEFLSRYLVVNAFQEALRDFLVAYKAWDATYRSTDAIPSAKYQAMQKLASYLRNNLVVSEQSSLRKTITLLVKATKAINFAQEIIEVYRQIEVNSSSINPLNRAEVRKVRLDNEKLAGSVEKQEAFLSTFVKGSAEILPAQGGIWSSVFGSSKPAEVPQETTLEQQESVFAGPLLEILRSARTKCEHKVASML